MNKEEEIPFVAFGNEELIDQPLADDFADCPNCKKKHKIEFGTNSETGEVSKMLGFVNCEDGESYLVTLNGKVLPIKEQTE